MPNYAPSWYATRAPSFLVNRLRASLACSLSSLQQLQSSRVRKSCRIMWKKIILQYYYNKKGIKRWNWVSAERHARHTRGERERERDTTIVPSSCLLWLLSVLVCLSYLRYTRQIDRRNNITFIPISSGAIGCWQSAPSHTRSRTWRTNARKTAHSPSAYVAPFPRHEHTCRRHNVLLSVSREALKRACWWPPLRAKPPEERIKDEFCSDTSGKILY